MGIGISISISANKRGGFKLATGNDHILGLFEIAMGSGDSSNPFQDLALGEKMIFDPLNVSTFAPVKDRIREIFDDFKERELAALQERPDNLKIIETAQAEAGILIYAINLETGGPFSFSVTGTKNGLITTLLG